MLNYYLMYAATWGIVFVLYELGISDLNSPLGPGLLAFFAILVVFCGLMGYRLRDSFQYRSLSRRRPCGWPAIAVVAGITFVAFARMGYVPIASVLAGGLTHDDLRASAPGLLHTVGVASVVYIFTWSVCTFLDGRRWQDLLKAAAVLAIALLYANRGLLLTCVLPALLLEGVKGRSVGREHATAASIFLVGLAALWLFGAAGNVRQGYSWDDSSYIIQLGLYGNRWPDVIPGQFAWAYSYATSPLVNLNYGVRTGAQSTDLLNFIYDFAPMAISKRLPGYAPVETPLAASYFTAVPVWSTYYAHAGICGMLCGLAVQLVLLYSIRQVTRGTSTETVALALSTSMVIFTTFANSFAYPMFAYPVYLAAAIGISERLNGICHVRYRVCLRWLPTRPLGYMKFKSSGARAQCPAACKSHLNKPHCVDALPTT